MPGVMLTTTTLDNSMSTNSNRDLGRAYLDVASHLFRLKSLGGVFVTTFATPITSGNGTTLKAKESLV
jgi:hypothetical protein